MAGRPGAPAGAGPASAVTGQPSTAQPAARQAGAVFGRTPSQPASGPAAQQPSSGEEEDDRLFYYDDEKPAPQLPIGTRVRVESNDKMVSGIWQA